MKLNRSQNFRLSDLDKTRLANIQKKLNLKTDSEAIRYVLKTMHSALFSDKSVSLAEHQKDVVTDKYYHFKGINHLKG